MFVITKPNAPNMMLARYVLAQQWTADLYNAVTFQTVKEAREVKLDDEGIREIKE